MGKNGKNLDFSSVAATFEKAITYVFAGSLIRNAEVRGSIPLCSTNNTSISSHLQLPANSYPFSLTPSSRCLDENLRTGISAAPLR